jgi:hypothetical protein
MGRLVLPAAQISLFVVSPRSWWTPSARLCKIIWSDEFSTVAAVEYVVKCPAFFNGQKKQIK